MFFCLVPFKFQPQMLLQLLWGNWACYILWIDRRKKYECDTTMYYVTLYWFPFVWDFLSIFFVPQSRNRVEKLSISIKKVFIIVYIFCVSTHNKYDIVMLYSEHSYAHHVIVVRTRTFSNYISIKFGTEII